MAATAPNSPPQPGTFANNAYTMATSNSESIESAIVSTCRYGRSRLTVVSVDFEFEDLRPDTSMDKY